MDGRQVDERAALGCFVAYLVIAYPVLLFHFGKEEWFIRDDWLLIVGSTTSTPFSPVEQHWITLPILAYRALFHFFGANFKVFLGTTLLFHLGNASLLRVVMRRAGVSPWIATACASLLVLFGPGHVSIIFSIGLTQDSSMFLGLLQLVLADHDGSIDRRDWLGLLSGALALMCSGVAPIVVIGVGVAALMRRGLRVSLFHTAPLAAEYLVWFAIERPLSYAGEDPYSLPFSLRQELATLWQGHVHAMAALGHWPVLACVMAATLVIGLLIRTFAEGGRISRSGMTAPLGLLACAPIYFAIVGLQRSRAGVEYIGYSHHLYNAACFTLPALACGADALSRRSKAIAVAFAALFVIPIPSHCRQFDKNRTHYTNRTFTKKSKAMLLATANSHYAEQVSQIERERPVIHPWYGLQLGWVLDRGAEGKFPNTEPVDPTVDDRVQLFFGIKYLGVPPTVSQCTERARVLEFTPQRGDEIITVNPAILTNLRHGEGAKITFSRAYVPDRGYLIRFELPNMKLRLEPLEEGSTLTYCPPRQPTPGLTADEAMRKAITSDPSAMEALRRAIASDPAAMEALRKEMQTAAKRDGR